jgi:hypothetical protein
LLLMNPEDDSMYEVEVMLGETDETHIIRAIEYWDREKRKWPQRQHFAVLVAEHINRRFFNVIHLMSYSIPVIAVEASILNVDGKKVLHFVKILNTYEEVEDGTSLDKRNYDREYWDKRAKWTLDAADSLLRNTNGVFGSATLSYAKSYVAITVDGYNYMRLHKRSPNKSFLKFRMTEDLQDEVAGLLDGKNITFVRKPKTFGITVDKDMIDRNAELVTSLAAFVKRSWDAA